MLHRVIVLLVNRLTARPRTVWLGLAALLAIAIGVSTLGSKSTRGDKLLVGRIWIDHMPMRDTEHYEVFLAIDEGSVGIFQRASSYEGAFELFKHEPRGDGKIQLLFPQSKKKYEVKYEAKSCREKGFDYCLALDGAPRGAPKYFSKNGWELEGRNTADLERVLTEWESKNISTERE